MEEDVSCKVRNTEGRNPEMAKNLRELTAEEQAHLDRLVRRTIKPGQTVNAWFHICREAEKADLMDHLNKALNER
jgi:hypothetical protein